ncbi:MAG: hypothetical protein Q8P48_06505, partial [Deltaproteobacteria bacterium]|nr:hypothetical protein [Deltaproteobacteria bacterium]
MGAAYALALVSVPVIAAVAFYYPSYLLAALLFVTVIQEAVFVSVYNLTTLNKIIGALLLFAVLIRALAEGRIHRAVNMVSVSLAALLLYLVSSYLILSVDDGPALQNINNFVSGYAYYFLCLLAVRRERDVAMIALAYLAGGLIVAYSGAFWEALLNPMEYMAPGGHQGIRSTIAGHYIEYAIRCVIPLPVALVLLSSKGLLKWRHFGLLLAAAAVL